MRMSTHLPSNASLRTRWRSLAMAVTVTLSAAGCARRDVAACPAAPAPSVTPPSAASPPTPLSTPPPPAAEPGPVVRVGARFQYKSAILHEERAYWLDL